MRVHHHSVEIFRGRGRFGSELTGDVFPLAVDRHIEIQVEAVLIGIVFHVPDDDAFDRAVGVTAGDDLVPDGEPVFPVAAKAVHRPFYPVIAGERIGGVDLQRSFAG